MVIIHNNIYQKRGVCGILEKVIVIYVLASERSIIMKNKVISLLLIVVLMASMIVPVSAHDDHVHVDTASTTATPRYINFCPYCERTMHLDCNKWNYGVTGTLVDTSYTACVSGCIVQYYQSLSYWCCSYCNYHQSTGSYHYCYEYHSCKGMVKSCDIEYI